MFSVTDRGFRGCVIRLIAKVRVTRASFIMFSSFVSIVRQNGSCYITFVAAHGVALPLFESPPILDSYSRYILQLRPATATLSVAGTLPHTAVESEAITRHLYMALGVSG
jgi:hypothetical protein